MARGTHGTYGTHATLWRRQTLLALAHSSAEPTPHVIEQTAREKLFLHQLGLKLQ